MEWQLQSLEGVPEFQVSNAPFEFLQGVPPEPWTPHISAPVWILQKLSKYGYCVSQLKDNGWLIFMAFIISSIVWPFMVLNIDSLFSNKLSRGVYRGGVKISVDLPPPNIRKTRVNWIKEVKIVQTWWSICQYFHMCTAACQKKYPPPPTPKT